METEEPPKAEVTAGVRPTKHPVLQSPRKKAESPGVLQLGQVLAEKAVEVEAVRILVPKAAISHVIPTRNAKARSPGHRKGEPLGQAEGAVEPRKELSEVKNVVAKLKNSERRLLQDKEGLSNQLRVQTEVRTASQAPPRTLVTPGPSQGRAFGNHTSSSEGGCRSLRPVIALGSFLLNCALSLRASGRTRSCWELIL